MRKNIIQVKTVGADGRIFIEGDWFSRGLPANIVLSESAYLDTSYGFSAFCSEEKEGLVLDEASGCYGAVNFIISKTGKVSVGKFCVINEATLVCNNAITIGSHCMLAWGSVITDSWPDASSYPCNVRRELLTDVSENSSRPYPFAGKSMPVVLEDNCWVGFGAVIMPGVRLGRGCVVGCKTVVMNDVPPYAVITGSPAKIVKYLQPDDTVEARERAVQDYI